jgi:hypothetical protein
MHRCSLFHLFWQSGCFAVLHQEVYRNGLPELGIPRSQFSRWAGPTLPSTGNGSAEVKPCIIHSAGSSPVASVYPQDLACPIAAAGCFWWPHCTAMHEMCCCPRSAAAPAAHLYLAFSFCCCSDWGASPGLPAGRPEVYWRLPAVV